MKTRFRIFDVFNLLNGIPKANLFEYNRKRYNLISVKAVLFTFLLILLAIIGLTAWHGSGYRICLSPNVSLVGVIFFPGFFAPFIDGNIGLH